MKNIYLASPFFNDEQLNNEEEVAQLLEKNPTVNYVFRPRHHQDVNEFGSEAWRWNTFMSDINQIKMCDIVVAVLDFIEHNGEVVPDPGTTFEIGYAYALNKPVILVNYNQDATKLNLMLERSYTKLLRNPAELADLDFMVIMPDKDRPMGCV